MPKHRLFLREEEEHTPALHPSTLVISVICHLGKTVPPVSLSHCMEHAGALWQRGCSALAVLDFLLKKVECQTWYSKLRVPDSRLHIIISRLNCIALHAIQLVPPTVPERTLTAQKRKQSICNKLTGEKP